MTEQQQTSRPLAGRKALVTGGARRIGRGIALALARAGADVAITYNHSADEAAETVQQAEALGVQAMAVPCELHDPAAIVHSIAAAVAWTRGARPPGLDIVVNNAGAFAIAALEALTPEAWDAMFATNTRAPFLTARAALPHLRASPWVGRIINLGSLGGLHPWPSHAHYCASKSALHMLTQTMAKGWAPEVAVNCVAPGMIVTGSEPDAEYAHFAAKTPMQRNGTIADVAELVVFLASASPFLTGQIIAVDGGLGL